MPDAAVGGLRSVHVQRATSSGNLRKHSRPQERSRSTIIDSDELLRVLLIPATSGNNNDPHLTSPGRAGEGSEHPQPLAVRADRIMEFLSRSVSS